MSTRFSPLSPSPDTPGIVRGLGNAVLRCGSIAELRSLAPLPLNAQTVIDKAVTDVGLERLVVVGDLLAKGLVFNLPDPLSIPDVYWEAQSKVGAATRTMNPGARGQNDLVDRVGFHIPVYATTEHFDMGIRLLRASERVGAPLDTTMVTQATRRINESIEDAAWNGATTQGGTALKVNGYGAPGILTHSAVNAYQYQNGAVGRAWDDPAKTGENILADFLDMVEILQGDYFYGPYTGYVPTSEGLKLLEDYKSATSGTIGQRLAEAGVTFRVADRLPTNKVVLMQQTSDVMDIIVGQEPIPITWESANGMERFFMLLAFMIPRVKQDYDGNCGIVVGSTT